MAEDKELQVRYTRGENSSKSHSPGMAVILLEVH